MRLRTKRGQSTLEYIIVFAAIVAAIMLYAYLRLAPAIDTTLGEVATKITTAAANFTQ